jgi:hypothetical protein
MTDFADGQGIFGTTVCDTCHSPGGAFDGVALAKGYWKDGIYDMVLYPKTGTEKWCASCHDDEPANSKQDDSGILAPNKVGKGSFGYYLTGHGLPVTGAYNATLHGQNGPEYRCTVCPDPTSDHISGVLDDSHRLHPVADDGLEYTTDLSEVCLDCHQVGQTAWGSLGYDAAAEATLHASGVTGNYADVSAYRYQCSDCHDAHGTEKLAMVLPEIDGKLRGESNPVLVSGFDLDKTDLTGLDPTEGPDDGVCDLCHTPGSGNPPHPDTNHPGNHNWGDRGGIGTPAGCVHCHKHSFGFAHGTGGTAGCGECHGHDPGHGGPNTGGAGTYISHSTHTEDDEDDAHGPHVGCADCHYDEDGDDLVEDYGRFADGNPLATTSACNACHSPYGTFDGVHDPDIGCIANWASSVYDHEDMTLQSGKEQWCGTCHDDEPASSRHGLGVDVTVDTLEVDLACSWTYESGLAGAYNGDHYYHGPGDGSCTVAWTVELPVAGDYHVYAWWEGHPNGATDAKYTIHYDGGSDAVERNQQMNGGQWNFLGTYPFVRGAPGYVVLSDEADGHVVADAIQLDNGSNGVSVNAPNVIGDNADYGFYVTGHKIDCLSCHDAAKEHIDHEHRTYEIDEAGSHAVVTAYHDSYRLTIPTQRASQDLCFVCHNSAEVLGVNASDVRHTNFWHHDADIVNSHWLHLVSFDYLHFDSDWDGQVDSAESCIACHNVHGSLSRAMIRRGELISTYGTTDKVPALNFSYLLEPAAFDTATWTPALADDTYSVYARWTAGSNRTQSAIYTIHYEGGSERVEHNQQKNGDQWNLLGTYPFAVGSAGYVELTGGEDKGLLIADAVGWDMDGGTPDVIVDDGDGGFATVGDWACPSASGGYEEDFRYAKRTAEPHPEGFLPDSAGGRMAYGGPSVEENGVCAACHGAISYDRAPFLGPKVLMAESDPDAVADDGSGEFLVTAVVLDPDDDVTGVEIDLSPLGGPAGQALYDDGTHGDEVSGDETYSRVATLPTGVADGTTALQITAVDRASNTGVGIVLMTVVDSHAIYVDTPDATFLCDDWVYAVRTGGAFFGDQAYHAPGQGSCTAVWRPYIGTAGTYDVFAWWEAGSDLATDAKYTIYYDGGSERTLVNQALGGSQWTFLGRFPFAMGSSGHIGLSDDADGYVAVDAVKFVPSQ